MSETYKLEQDKKHLIDYIESLQVDLPTHNVKYEMEKILRRN